MRTIKQELTLFILAYLAFLLLTTSILLAASCFLVSVDGIQTIGSNYKIFGLMLPFVFVALCIFIFRTKITYFAKLTSVSIAHFCFYFLALPFLFCVLGCISSNNYCSAKIVGAKKIKDDLLGYRYQPLGIRQEQLFYNNSFVKTATYSYDSFGRRTMPFSALHNKATLFFGCSFAYGDGVNDDETLPFYFCKKDTAANIFNYALDGYGPQQTYILTRDKDLIAETKCTKANGIYVYIEDQIKRAVPYKSHFWGWTNIFPAFNLENDSLVYMGSMQQAHPIQALLFALLNNSLLFSGIDLPKNIQESNYRLVTALIAKSAENFKRQYPQGNFYVLIYPNQDTTIVPFLRKKNIQIMIPGALFPSNSTYFIPHHDHPTPKANKELAEYLYLKLN